MPNLFISYRREDSAAMTGRLFDRLREHFGIDSVFRDIDAIAFGAEFGKVIETRIGACDALIAVIGKRWLAVTGESGRRRLDDPDDFVKAEIGAALRQNKLVIPVLVDGAKVPRRNRLPEDIRAVADRHAAEISESRFDYDVQRLVEAIENGNAGAAMGGSLAGRVQRWWRQALRPDRWRLLAFLGPALAALVLAGWLVVGRDAPTPAAEGVPTEAQTSASLEHRKEQIIAALAASAPDDGLRELLRNELASVQAKLHNLAESRTARLNSLRQLDRMLAELAASVPESTLEAARRALLDNDTAPAETLLAELAAGADKPLAAQAAFQLAELAYANVDYRQALDHYLQAVKLRPDDATYLNMAGRLAHERGLYAQAQDLLERALALRRQGLPASHPDLAESLNNLALVYKDRQRYAAAEALYQEALTAQWKEPGRDDRLVATILSNLARLYRAAGPQTAAMKDDIEKLLRQALQLMQGARGDAHPDVATALNNLASFYWNEGRYAEAEPLYEKALAIREKALPPQHPDVAESLNNLAASFDRKGDYKRAEAAYLKVIVIQRSALGPEHPKLATTLNNLAEVYRKQRLFAPAEARYREALAIQKKAFGPDHSAVALTQHNLALSFFDQQQYDKAEALLRPALEVLQRQLPAGDAALATVMASYADCLERLHRVDEARSWRARLPAAASS